MVQMDFHIAITALTEAGDRLDEPGSYSSCG